ncbi:MAG: putative transposase [Gammaproteobacteria bacterium]|jgi:putative transposase
MKQQLLVVSRSRRRAPNLSALDRFLLGLWSLFLSPRHIERAAVIIRPSTLFKFHDILKKRKYRLLYSSTSRRKPGPSGPSPELVRAIVEMKLSNPRFGCRRIAMQITKAFGIDIDKGLVRRVLQKHYCPKPNGGGPSWLTFLGHSKNSLWSIDLFRCESILLKSHWVLVVMDQFTRRIIGFGVHAGDVDGIAICRMFNSAISNQGVPHYLSSDNDPLFRYHRWKANLRILDIDEIKSIPYTPQSHPFVERLIGTIRREYLDHVFFWNARDLERKLVDFADHYNRERPHHSLGGVSPAVVSGEPHNRRANIGDYSWQQYCNGLFQLPMAA